MRLLFFAVFILLLVSCSRSDNPKLLFDRGQYQQAIALWHPLANNGDLLAQNYIGIHYYLGLGVERNLESARAWFEKAATNGFPDAQYNLGIMYENGEAIEQDYVIASMWFYVASKNGNNNAKKRVQVLLNDDKLFPNQYTHAKNLAKKYLNIENN